MATLTLEDVYKGLSSRMDTMTDELVKVSKGLDSVSYRVGSIEAGLSDVELKNGGGRIVKQPRQQLIQQAYDYVKPGGILDEKFQVVDDKIDEVEEVMIKKFQDCQQRYNPDALDEKAEKKWDMIWKWSSRVALVVIAIATVILAIDWEKIMAK